MLNSKNRSQWHIIIILMMMIITINTNTDNNNNNNNNNNNKLETIRNGSFTGEQNVASLFTVYATLFALIENWRQMIALNWRPKFS